MTTHRDEIIDKGIKAALDLAASRSWESLTLNDIALAAGLELGDFHGVAGKQTLSDAVLGWLDKAMSAEGIDPNATPRERLFDVIMLRFEAMEPYREGLKSLFRWQERHPIQLAKRLPARKASADWALVSAGLDGEGDLPFDVRSIGIGWAIGQAERAWEKETDPTFTRTMAALDKALRQLDDRAEMIARFTGKRRSKTEERTSAADADAPEAPPEGTSQA